MNQLIKVLTPLFFIIIYITFTSLYNRKIEPVHGYPIWMKDSTGYYSQQTSGLFFIGREGNKKIFLSADDNSRIDRISVDESFTPPRFDLQTIHFDLPTTKVLYKILSKWDFEDIVYNSATNKIIVSVEGNDNQDTIHPLSYRDTEGIYEFTFNKTLFTCDTIYEVKKLPMPDVIYKYINNNIGFEGMGMTDDYFYMGLENITDEKAQFSDSTYLYIVNRKTNDVKTISSKLFDVKTISALYAADNYTLYGIDRDSKKIFFIKFNNDFTIKEFRAKPFELTMPLHEDISMDRMAGMEAITLDDEGNIYTDIDPWSNLYNPNYATRKFLTEDERQNVNKFIPVMYKYKNPFK